MVNQRVDTPYESKIIQTSNLFYKKAENKTNVHTFFSLHERYVILLESQYSTTFHGFQFGNRSVWDTFLLPFWSRTFIWQKKKKREKFFAILRGNWTTLDNCVIKKIEFLSTCPFSSRLSSLSVMFLFCSIIHFAPVSSFFSFVVDERIDVSARERLAHAYVNRRIETKYTWGFLFHGGPRTESWVQCLLDESFPSTSPCNHHHRFSRRSLLSPLLTFSPPLLCHLPDSLA